MAENPLYKRRRYFINKGLQGRFTACFLILGFFISLGASMFIWRFLTQEFDRFIYRSHFSPITPWEVVFPIMAKAFVVSTAALVILAYVFVHLVFKRISAKLLFFKNTLRNIAEGKLALTDPGAGLKDLNEPLKLFVETLKQDIMSLQAGQKRMKALVEKMEKTEEKAALLNDIEGMGKAFAEKLSNCRIVVGD